VSVCSSNAKVVKSRKLVSRRLLIPVGFIIVTAIVVQDIKAQIAGIAVLQPPPAEIDAIRNKQMELASAAGIEIMFADVGQRSETWLDVVPPDLLGPRIESEYDLLGVIENLYPYYGFSGTEVLTFYQRSELRPLHGRREKMEYTFREDIDGIPSNQFIFITGDAETKRLEGISGSPHIDRDLERIPRMTSRQAIDSATAWVRSGRNPDFGPIATLNLDGPHKATVVYEAWGEDRALTPVWVVELVSSEARDERRHVLVRPDGRVTGTEMALYR
jgi:hypothetical protein